MSIIPPIQNTFEFEIFGRMVGNGPFDMMGRPSRRHRALIIAELSVNHCGDLGMAEKMVEAAARAGADVVKLQLRNLEACYGKLSREESACDALGGLSFYMPVLRNTMLPLDGYAKLKELAESLGIGFLVTPFDVPSVAELEKLGVGAYKVASCDAVNPWLLDAVIATGKPMIVSTGMCSELEVFRTAGYLREKAPGRYALLHAISSYPTAFSDCQLHLIPRYKHNHCCPVGWSGHERAVAVSVAAAALGADIIERHFTLDRTLPGPDQAASLEPDGLKKLVDRVRAFETAYGDPVSDRRRPRGECATEEVMRKSLWVLKDVKAGDPVKRSDLTVVGPGRGMEPWVGLQLAEMGAVATGDLTRGHELKREDLNYTKKAATGPGKAIKPPLPSAVASDVPGASSNPAGINKTDFPHELSHTGADSVAGGPR